MIAVLGAGAFGTALAVSLARADKDVTLLARSEKHADSMRQTGSNPSRLPGVPLPRSLTVDVAHRFFRESSARTVLLAVPTQTLTGVLSAFKEELAGASLVACCKGFDVETGEGATAIITRAVPNAKAAILSGPSFAADIAKGLPTALTIAAQDGARDLQGQLSTQTLRLYRSHDPRGVEVGGAIKNVIAIACGASVGVGLGESARAALMTRGMAEIQRLAAALGADAETLMGLSGFGDLALTCTSELSRNFRFGLSLGKGTNFDPNTTVEGVTTARALVGMATKLRVDLPISAEVARLCDGNASVTESIQALLARPLRAE